MWLSQVELLKSKQTPVSRYRPFSDPYANLTHPVVAKFQLAGWRAAPSNQGQQFYLTQPHMFLFCVSVFGAPFFPFFSVCN